MTYFCNGFECNGTPIVELFVITSERIHVLLLVISATPPPTASEAPATANVEANELEPTILVEREAMRSNNRMDRLEAQKNQQVRQNEASGSDGHRTEGPA